MKLPLDEFKAKFAAAEAAFAEERWLDAMAFAEEADAAMTPYRRGSHVGADPESDGSFWSRSCHRYLESLQHEEIDVTRLAAIRGGSGRTGILDIRLGACDRPLDLLGLSRAADCLRKALGPETMTAVTLVVDDGALKVGPQRIAEGDAAFVQWGAGLLAKTFGGSENTAHVICASRLFEATDDEAVRRNRRLEAMHTLVHEAGHVMSTIDGVLPALETWINTPADGPSAGMILGLLFGSEAMTEAFACRTSGITIPRNVAKRLDAFVDAASAAKDGAGAEAVMWSAISLMTWLGYAAGTALAKGDGRIPDDMTGDEQWIRVFEPHWSGLLDAAAAIPSPAATAPHDQVIAAFEQLGERVDAWWNDAVPEPVRALMESDD